MMHNPRRAETRVGDDDKYCVQDTVSDILQI